jgi:lipopolysaccharide/colanic/teichoic acid biosynthesis glycosyltransferase
MSLSITPPPGEPRLPSSAPESGAAPIGASPAAEVSVSLPGVVRGPVPRVSLRLGAKRAFDIAISAALLVILLPVFVIVALLVRLDSPGPALFRCKRTGHRGGSLDLLKFRKMACDARGGPLTTEEDVRLTRVGRWLTKYKLDELPQLWQVLKGEMSLVGPRPEDPGFVERYADDYRDHILTVRPGIFGLSQLAFARENRILDPNDPVGHYVAQILPQKVALDRMYASRHDLWLDVRILVWSCVAVVLRRPVAVNRGSAAMGIRRRKRSRT